MWLLSAVKIGWRRRKRRTIASAQRTPKTVFSGTAIMVIRTESQSACSASGVVTDAHASAAPASNARQNTSATGNATSAAR